MSEIVISLQGIKKRYGMNKVLKGVNLEINKGDIVGLIGKNGSGKTTIFKIILGLSDYQAGELFIGDEGDSLKAGRAKTGFFIGMNFFPYMTAKQNLKYYCKLKGIKARGEVNRVLEIVGLKGVKNKVSEYSVGMKQRLGIANAILGNPEILILDEPTNGLDPQGIAEIRNLLKKLNQEYGTTILISTHILGELQNTADHFAILDNGVISKVLSKDDLKVESEFVNLKLNAENVRMAREVLEHVGIQVLEEQKETVSLEDYYFSTINGEAAVETTDTEVAEEVEENVESTEEHAADVVIYDDEEVETPEVEVIDEVLPEKEAEHIEVDIELDDVLED